MQEMRTARWCVVRISSLYSAGVPQEHIACPSLQVHVQMVPDRSHALSLQIATHSASLVFLIAAADNWDGTNASIAKQNSAADPIASAFI